MKKELEELRKELNARIDKLVGKDKLIVGDWYQNCYGAITNYQGGNKGYGLDCYGNWITAGCTFEYYPEEWSPCPIEKVEAALKKEADKRGYKDGMLIEAPSGAVYTLRDSGDSFIIRENFYYKGCLLMKAGKWARIVPKEEDIFIGNYKVEFTEGGVIINGVHLSKQFFQDVAYITESKDRLVWINFGLGGQVFYLPAINKILDRLK